MTEADREELLHMLRASEARYRTVVETSPTLIVGVDPAGTITLVNAAVETATGFSREALLGRHFSEVLPAASGAPDRTDFDAAAERTMVTREGVARRVEWRYGHEGELTYAFGIDVTDTRAIERRVRVAEQLAVVGELTAGLAHEIRNPLNSALLELKVHARKLARAEDPSGLASVDAVRQELERIERILADFLWFARPKSVKMQTGSLAVPAEAVVRMVSAEALDRGITLEIDFDHTAPVVTFDEDRVRQLAFNLVRNAMEALPQGGTVVIRVRSGGAMTELTVEDNGPGIPGDLSRVFLPFYTTKPSGTGLGLTVAQRIAFDHDGELRVESAPGRTAFTLSLPVRPR